MKPYLSISEACVWAATRDLDALDAVTERNPESAHWLFNDSLPVGYDFHVLAWRRHLLELAGKPPMPDVWEAFTQLRQLCGNERLTMFGIARDDGDPEPIPSIAWAGLEISHNASCADYVAAMRLDLGNPSARWWTRLRLRSVDVQRIWPPIATATEQPNTQGTIPAKPRKPAYDEILAWYVDRVTGWPQGRLPPSRPDDEQAARQYFKGKGMDGRGLRDDVRDARKEKAPASWQESGAKPTEAHVAHRKAAASNLDG
jgi:hypothetical protein